MEDYRSFAARSGIDRYYDRNSNHFCYHAKCRPRTLENNQFQLPNGTIVNLNNPNVWEDYAVTVDDVEALTGYDFLSELPEEIQDAIEQRRNQNFIV
ncbi:DNA/RNA non-specific endonuclease [Tychonema sp. LEGE 07203]|nr:DNA/RNA non-specific endonuclease [Tychonema sp. LEGE 07203]MBE9095124.1 DNA/RNA non-specific endonuclease [Tychonema sp. LEGE 07203]